MVIRLILNKFSIFNNEPIYKWWNYILTNAWIVSKYINKYIFMEILVVFFNH